ASPPGAVNPEVPEGVQVAGDRVAVHLQRGALSEGHAGLGAAGEIRLEHSRVVGGDRLVAGADVERPARSSAEPRDHQDRHSESRQSAHRDLLCALPPTTAREPASMKNLRFRTRNETRGFSGWLAPWWLPHYAAS